MANEKGTALLSVVLEVGQKRLKQINKDFDVSGQIEQSIFSIVAELEFLEYVFEKDGVTVPAHIQKTVDDSCNTFKEIAVNTNFSNRWGYEH